MKLLTPKKKFYSISYQFSCHFIYNVRLHPRYYDRCYDSCHTCYHAVYHVVYHVVLPRQLLSWLPHQLPHQLPRQVPRRVPPQAPSQSLRPLPRQIQLRCHVIAPVTALSHPFQCYHVHYCVTTSVTTVFRTSVREGSRRHRSPRNGARVCHRPRIPMDPGRRGRHPRTDIPSIHGTRGTHRRPRRGLL